MAYKKYKVMKDKVERDLDLQEETFITPDELLGYFNEALQEAVAEIHDIYEDYYLTGDTLALVADQDVYDMPADIYANKLRRVEYRNGTTYYTVRRLNDFSKFDAIAQVAANGDTSSEYCYYLKNPSRSDLTDSPAVKMVLVPPARETDSVSMTRWYLREVALLTGDDEEYIDVPECANDFVEQYVKVRCYEKESHPNLQVAIAALEAKRRQMTDTLSNMVPDNDNKMLMDTSFYCDHV